MMEGIKVEIDILGEKMIVVFLGNREFEVNVSRQIADKICKALLKDVKE